MLVVRVHNDFLKAERIPPSLITKHIWKERFRTLTRTSVISRAMGVVIRKFFLHVSKAEQKRRFLSRLDEPSKNWKFSAADLKEREYWDEYQDAYEDMIRPHFDRACALVCRAPPITNGTRTSSWPARSSRRLIRSGSAFPLSPPSSKKRWRSAKNPEKVAVAIEFKLSLQREEISHRPPVKIGGRSATC